MKRTRVEVRRLHRRGRKPSHTPLAKNACCRVLPPNLERPTYQEKGERGVPSRYPSYEPVHEVFSAISLACRGTLNHEEKVRPNRRFGAMQGETEFKVAESRAEEHTCQLTAAPPRPLGEKPGPAPLVN